MTVIRDIISGDIHHTHCTLISPPDNKFHVFFEVGDFFLINTKFYYDSVKISPCDYEFLDYDSHICFSYLFNYPTNNSIEPRTIRGSLVTETINELKKGIPNNDILTPIQKRKVIQYLNNILNKRNEPQSSPIA
jgi:hypothetical protein